MGLELLVPKNIVKDDNPKEVFEYKEDNSDDNLITKLVIKNKLTKKPKIIPIIHQNNDVTYLKINYKINSPSSYVKYEIKNIPNADAAIDHIWFNVKDAEFIVFKGDKLKPYGKNHNTHNYRTRIVNPYPHLSKYIGKIYNENTNIPELKDVRGLSYGGMYSLPYLLHYVYEHKELYLDPVADKFPDEEIKLYHFKYNVKSIKHNGFLKSTRSNNGNLTPIFQQHFIVDLSYKSYEPGLDFMRFEEEN